MQRIRSGRVGSAEAQEQHQKMTTAPLPRLIMLLAVPTTISQLVTVIYNTVDTYFVSIISMSATAAIGVVFSVMTVIQAVGYGFSMGCSSLISRSLGAEDQAGADKYASSALLGGIASGAVISVAGIAFLGGWMRLIGATETILPYAMDYARYILLGAPVICASFVLSFILRSEGKAYLSMLGLCAGTVLNIALDPLLIFRFGLGISGAAIATVVSQLVSFLILLCLFMSGKSIVNIRLSSVSRKPSDYWLIISTGLPTVFRQGLGSVATALLNIQAAAFGDAAVAAVTIASKVYMFVRNIVLGVGHGFQPVAGYNYGNGDMRRTRGAFHFVCLLGTGVCVFCAVLCAVFAGQIVGVFSDDAEVIRLCLFSVYGSCLVMPFLAYSTYVNQLYQCLGFRAPATFLASCRQGIVFIPIAFLLRRLMGVNGVLLAQSCSDLIVFLICIPFQIVFCRKQLSGRPPAA